jgi:hypothetical protein
MSSKYYDRIAEMPVATPTPLTKSEALTRARWIASNVVNGHPDFSESDVCESIDPMFYTIALAAYRARKDSLIRTARGQKF